MSIIFDYAAINRAGKDASKPEEGGPCPSCSGGKLLVAHRGESCNCAAMNHPPCWYCESTYLRCEACEAEFE